jgi:hypothetical protein
LARGYFIYELIKHEIRFWNYQSVTVILITVICGKISFISAFWPGKGSFCGLGMALRLGVQRIFLRFLPNNCMKYPHGFLKKSALGFLSLMLLESAQPYAASREELGIPSPKDMEHHGDHIYRDGIDPQILTKTYARTITDKKGDIFEVMMVETYPYIPILPISPR